MTELGIIRQVDDLGRLAIPKEIRRTLKIHEGDQVSISIDGENVVFRRIEKYAAPLRLLNDVIGDLLDSRWSHRKEEAIQLLRQAKEILENEGE